MTKHKDKPSPRAPRPRDTLLSVPSNQNSHSRLHTKLLSAPLATQCLIRHPGHSILGMRRKLRSLSYWKGDLIRFCGMNVGSSGILVVSLRTYLQERIWQVHPACNKTSRNAASRRMYTKQSSNLRRIQMAIFGVEGKVETHTQNLLDFRVRYTVDFGLEPHYRLHAAIMEPDGGIDNSNRVDIVQDDLQEEAQQLRNVQEAIGTLTRLFETMGREGMIKAFMTPKAALDGFANKK